MAGGGYLNCKIKQSHKSHNTLVHVLYPTIYLFPTIYHFGTEMCTLCCGICEIGPLVIKYQHFLYRCTSQKRELVNRDDSRFAPSQWDMALLCNDVSHWLGASLESALCYGNAWWWCTLVSHFYVHPGLVIYRFSKKITCISNAVNCCAK